MRRVHLEEEGEHHGRADGRGSDMRSCLSCGSVEAAQIVVHRKTDLAVLDTSNPRIVVAEPDHIGKMAVADGGDGVVVADNLRLDVRRIQTFV